MTEQLRACNVRFSHLSLSLKLGPKGSEALQPGILVA